MFEIVAYPSSLKRAKKIEKEFEENISTGLYGEWSFINKAMFAAQMGVETEGFLYLRELGRDAYFNKYEGRKDLGNIKQGDGLKYKGRGIIMITGRYNYDKYGKRLHMDLINNPEQAEEIDVAIKIALLYWTDKNLNSYGDDVRKVTKKINGGYNHLAKRQKWFNKIIKESNKDVV